MSKSRHIPLIAAVIVAALAGLLLARSLQKPEAANPALAAGTLLEPPRTLPAFSLQDTNGRPFAAAELKNHWSLLFFGFTNCPDVCPTTMSLLAQVKRSLGDLPPAQQPQVVFISVDPQRDTPDKLAAYLHFFNPEFIGLSGEAAQIDSLTKGLGVPVIVHNLENGGYTIDHSAAIFVVDPQAKLHALFSAPHAQAALAADIRNLVTEP